MLPFLRLSSGGSHMKDRLSGTSGTTSSLKFRGEPSGAGRGEE